ncbi:MAG TPA: hypothetical protein O0Y06_07570 [Methanocorpusculum sp.]|nr:hypothetical protein [Methanocorpusculum sp.]HJK80744.1 hypothetical protein [Methanocorpusculum sp.]
MLVIQRFCAVSMIALILLAFCCCPVIAAELDTHSASVESDQDALKEKIKKGCEKFKEGKYTQDIKVNTGSTVHHIVETLSYNNLSGEFEVTREVDKYLSVSPEEGTNVSPRSFMTLYKNGKKIVDGAFDLYGEIENVQSINDISLLIYNEVTGKKESELNIHSMSNVLLYDTDRGYWTFVRHTHYTSGEIEILLQMSDLVIAGVLTCFFTVLGFGGGGFAGWLIGTSVSLMLAEYINSKRNADGTMDTWETLHRFREWTDENTSPTLSDWCGERNFKKTDWWKTYQNDKRAGEEWMGYDILYGKFTAKGGAKYRGRPASSIDVPVYIRLG